MINVDVGNSFAQGQEMLQIQNGRGKAMYKKQGNAFVILHQEIKSRVYPEEPVEHWKSCN